MSQPARTDTTARIVIHIAALRSLIATCSNGPAAGPTFAAAGPMNKENKKADPNQSAPAMMWIGRNSKKNPEAASTLPPSRRRPVRATVDSGPGRFQFPRNARPEVGHASSGDLRRDGHEHRDGRGGDRPRAAGRRDGGGGGALRTVRPEPDRGPRPAGGRRADTRSRTEPPRELRGRAGGRAASVRGRGPGAPSP